MGCGRRGFVDSDASPIDAALAYRETVLADHPLAYWRLADSDITARDELGGDNGQYAGACTFGAPGAIAGNAAVTFDGSVTGNNFSGTIDEVAIYDTALSQARIVEHHASSQRAP
jgi:hypothetical protein